MNNDYRCIYCGSMEEITRDHVPPANLFPIPRPSNLLTVPCCKKCNDCFAKDDEHFRTMVAGSRQAAGHPQAQALWNQKIRKQLIKRNKSTIQELIDFSFGNNHDLKNAELRLARIVIRIVSGLFYVEKKHPIRNYRDIRINLEPDFTCCTDLSGAIKMFREIPEYKEKSIGSGVFQYLMVTIPNQEGEVWLLVFFDKLPFLATTSPKS